MADYDYIYYWDTTNKKKVYGGKHPRLNGYYGNNTAGNRQYMKGGGKPTEREFVGSQIERFVFFSETNGLRTIPAKSFEEAWRLAKLLGYSKRHYRGRA